MTRLAKAMSAFTPGRSGSADGRDARSFAGRDALLPADGTGAPSAALPGRSSAILAALGAFLAAALISLGLAPAALANGTVDVTVTGTGSGTVTSTSQTIPLFGAPGPADATPGEIDCDETGGPICNADIAAQGFNTNVRVTLTATADPGGGPFLGWVQSGATSVFAGCTYPAGSPETCAVNLNGTPGPTSTLVALFGDPPPAPETTTGDSQPGADFSLATLEGSIDPGGFAVTSCYFEYGPSADYGAVVPCDQDEGDIGSGSGDVSVSTTTEPLEPDTTYHYRLVASSELAAGIGGVGTGDDQTFTTTAAPVGDCPNEARRHEQGIVALLLPDCMALEMVNPGKKENQYARYPSLSPDGERVRYYSGGAIGDPKTLPSNFWNRYVASRGDAEWTSADALPTDPFLAAGRNFGNGQLFSPDFSRWFHMAATTDEFVRGMASIYRGGLGLPTTPLSPVLAPLDAANRHGGNVNTAHLQGASADHSHLYFEAGDSTTSYRHGDPVPAGSGSVKNGYVALHNSAGEPDFELLARDGDGKVWGGNCGAALGETGSTATISRNQGAVAADGSRAYFTTRPTQPASGNCSTANKQRILKRIETQAGPWITHLVPNGGAGECDRVAPVCLSADGDDFYQGASVDQTKVYFTTNRQLADSDLDGSAAQCSGTSGVSGCDLYLYDSTRPAGERLTQVSAGEDNPSHEAGKEAKVLSGIPAISGDGSHVYFTAEGVLTDKPNPEGAEAQLGQRNLYVYQRDGEHPEGRLAFVGTVSSDPSELGFNSASSTFRGPVYPVPATGKDEDGNEIGGSGHILVFQSKASLTADDTDGGFRDVFRYNAQDETLERVSVAAPGGADNGSFDVAIRRLDVWLIGGIGSTVENYNGPDFAEAGRWVSEDGETVAFKTAEGLVPGDRNGVLDSYFVRDGQTHRIPGTSDPLAGTLSAGELRDESVLSHDGSTVAFSSYEQLLPFDGDTSISVYALRIDGGYKYVPDPPLCKGEEGCQGAAPAAPSAADAGSATLPGAGNVRPGPGDRCRATARRAQQLSQRAKRLRNNAKRVQGARQARRMRTQSRRLSKRATNLSRNAKRCRQNNQGGNR